jgi:hypothetical protein
MGTHTHHESTTQSFSSKNHQVHVLLHHLHKAHIECLGSPNTSLLNPKLLYLHLTQNQYYLVAQPTREPTQFSSSPKFCRSVIYYSPCRPLHNLPDMFHVGILHQGLVQSVSRLLGLPDHYIICPNVP